MRISLLFILMRIKTSPHIESVLRSEVEDSAQVNIIDQSLVLYLVLPLPRPALLARVNKMQRIKPKSESNC